MLRAIPPGGERGGLAISMQGRGMDATDVSKIVLLGPNESKRIGIILDAQPRAMLINTLFSKNIPGELTIPTGEITKAGRNIKPVTNEEIIIPMPQLNDPSEIIVDNEDPGFNSSKQNLESPLKKLLGIENNDGKTYRQVSLMRIPEYWQPVVESNYFGKYILSSVYTRGGTGDKTVTWAVKINDPAYYDIYCYVGKAVNRVMVMGGPGGGRGPGDQVDMRGGQPSESQYKDMHYKIYHDEGIEEITLDYENAEGGWNNLGSYYLSSDSAKVVLTNQSQGKIVIGDAIKWVKQN
jgi:hypothetical protein